MDMERNEAIKIVKENMHLSYDDGKIFEALKILVPELKEFEDERMMKDIVAAVEMHGDLTQGRKSEIYAYLKKQKEQKPEMILWTGKNLKEVVDFTGKYPRLDEWFKSWEEYENYVHSHNNIFKLFCEDGSHYEVPVGSWIVKTPDGFNIPSHFKFVQKPTEWSEEDERVRKEIIKYFENEKRNTIRTVGDLDILNRWIAHLEKQKEQKPDFKYGCPFTDDELMTTDFWKEYLKDSIIPGNKPTKQDIDFLLPIARKYFCLVMKETCTICKERSNGYQEGLEAGKQSTAEWNEVDKATLDSVIAVIEEWEDKQSEEEKEYYGEHQKSDFLKSLPERFNLQPKQEWSEEDKRILKGIIGKINHDQSYGVSKEEMLNFLRDLHPQQNKK